MHPKAKEYVDKLQLSSHPEGGYFKEVYRSNEIIKAGSLPGRYSTDRSVSTSIYFLLEGRQISSLHKLKSDEIWHFYDGTSLLIYSINDKGKLNEFSLGSNSADGDVFQAVIPKGSWFGAELKDKSSFALIGCTVAPGFDFEDFELANQNYLLKLHPKHSEIIKKLTKFEH